MYSWLKTAKLECTTDAQIELFEDYYGASFDATAGQLRSLLTELDRETTLPAPAVEALKKAIRISLNDVYITR